MREKASTTREETITAPRKQDADTKAGRAGRGLPLEEAHMLRIRLAVSETLDYNLPDVNGD